MARVGLNPAPASPFNVPIGPHRRYAWVDADLDDVKAIKNAFGGTLNDAVLTAVTLATGRWMREHGHPTEGVVLRAMVPVSIRADAERGALGNRVAAMYAPLPVGVQDPRAAFDAIHEAMVDLKELRAGRRRAGHHPARGLRARRRSSPRPAGCRPASASSTSS